MAVRIVGVDLPQNKRGEIALTYIFGIGRSSANKILAAAGVDKDIKVQDWTDAQAAAVREAIGAGYKVEGDLRARKVFAHKHTKRRRDFGRRFFAFYKRNAAIFGVCRKDERSRARLCVNGEIYVVFVGLGNAVYLCARE